jgi:hypothetical protein
LTGRADHPLNQVAAEFALRHRFKHVARKFLAQDRFELELRNLALLWPNVLLRHFARLPTESAKAWCF